MGGQRIPKFIPDQSYKYLFIHFYPKSWLQAFKPLHRTTSPYRHTLPQKIMISIIPISPWCPELGNKVVPCVPNITSVGEILIIFLQGFLQEFLFVCQYNNITTLSFLELHAASIQNAEEIISIPSNYIRLLSSLHA